MAILGSQGSLRDRLGEAGFGHVSQIMGPAMAAPMLDAFPAWLASMLLLYGPVFEAQARSGVTGMDNALAAEAGAAGMPHRPLETLEFQLQLMASTEAESLEGLRDPASMAAKARSVMEDVTSACRATDPAMVEAAIRSSMEDASAERLLVERNRAWMPVLLEELGQGGALVAVGTGHMVGEQGLVRLLTDAGYRLTPQRGPAATWTASPVPWPQIAPFVALDAPTRSAWLDATVSRGNTLLCAEGSLLRGPDEQGVCEAKVARWAELCVVQAAPTLLGAEPTEAGVQRLVGCAATGGAAQMALGAR
jgi:hypothetical protein